MEDLEGWEVLPEDGFLQIHDDEGKKIFSRNYGAAGSTVFKNYFICPASNSTKFVDSTNQEEGEEHFNSRTVPNQHLFPISIIELKKAPGDDDQVNFKDICEIPLGKTIKPSPLLVENPKEADQDPVSQVFFKKMKETETKFVDMKILESPTRVMKPPPLQVDSAPAFQLVEGKGESFDMQITSPRSLMKGEEHKITHDGWVEEQDSGSGGGGFDIWKWSLTGIGAIFSFGVATVCIIFLGARHRDAKHHDENHRLQFHIYADDKRLKEAVRHATKLNEAMSAVRGSASARLSQGTAHIGFGGYYDESL